MNVARRMDTARHTNVDYRMNVVQLHKVSLFYGKTAALRDVSLSIAQGEHLCVLGGNGSGKSTLALVLAGLLAPDEGSVELVGRAVYDDGRSGKRLDGNINGRGTERSETRIHARIDNEAYRQARRSLGLVFQNPDEQIVTSIVEDDVAFGPENLGLDSAEIQKRVARELHRVAMQNHAQAHPMCLSGGQKQRVALAGALAMHPQLLVLDEPGALLDVRGRRSVMGVLDKLKDAGTTIVHITHFMEEALKADRVLVMHQGRIVADDAPDAIFKHVEKIVDSQLELPFAAQLATKLQQVNIPVSWTTSAETLCRELAEQLRGCGEGFGSERSECGDAARGGNAIHSKPSSEASTANNAFDSTFISAQNLSFSYGADSRWMRSAGHRVRSTKREAPEEARASSRAALLDLNFSIQKGSYTALIGQTGSGKTTLVRLLCGLAKPDAGSLIVAGHDTKHKRERKLLNGLIGYVMQQPERQLFAETVYDDVAFGPNNLQLPTSEVAQRTEQALRAVALWHKKDASPFELSGGQARLAALAGILAMQPKILLVDEPTAGLDPKGRREVLRLLKRIHVAGTTLVHITHAMEEAARAEKIIVLNQSRILMQGTPQEIFTPAYQALLTKNGLDLPEPLLFAQRLNEKCGREVLGQTLSLSELIASITDCVRTPGDARAADAKRTPGDARGASGVRAAEGMRPAGGKPRG